MKNIIVNWSASDSFYPHLLGFGHLYSGNAWLVQKWICVMGCNNCLCFVNKLVSLLLSCSACPVWLNGTSLWVPDQPSVLNTFSGSFSFGGRFHGVPSPFVPFSACSQNFSDEVGEDGILLGTDSFFPGMTDVSCKILSMRRHTCPLLFFPSSIKYISLCLCKYI